jgi:hypothetical protein
LLNINARPAYISIGNTRDQYCGSYAIGIFSTAWRQNPTLSSKGIHCEPVTVQARAFLASPLFKPALTDERMESGHAPKARFPPFPGPSQAGASLPVSNLDQCVQLLPNGADPHLRPPPRPFQYCYSMSPSDRSRTQLRWTSSFASSRCQAKTSTSTARSHRFDGCRRIPRNNRMRKTQNAD